MNEILQKRIEEAANTTVQNLYDYARQARNPKVSAYSEGYLDAIDTQGEFLFKEGANYALSNQWISVEEALPEENGRYLVYAPTYEKGSSSGLDFKDGIGFSRFCNRKWSIEIGYHKRPNCVTHWAEIPNFNE